MARGGVGQQLVDHLAGHAPAPHLPQQHHEQRRGVGRAVVDAPAAERQGGGVAEAHLVEDPTGLLVVAGVDVGALEPGQGLEHAAGQVGIDQQGHPGGEQGVAPEHGHEPRRTGRHHHPLGKVGIEDPQRAEVLGAAGDHLLQPRVVGLDLGHLAAPLGQALARASPGRPVGRTGTWGRRRPVDDRADLDAGRPLAPGGHDDLEGGQVGGGGRVLVEPDLHPPGHPAPAVGVRDHGPLDRQAAAGPTRVGRPCPVRRPRIRTASRGSPMVDSSPVAGPSPTRPSLTANRSAKSASDEHLDGAEGGLVGEVAEGEVLAHALAHVAGPEHHQGGVGPPGCRQAARHEGGGEGIVGDGGQRLGPGPVDQHLEPGEDAGVPEEEALGAPADMSPALPLMAKVDSSTRVTTRALESSWVTGPANVQGSAMRLPYRPTWSLE